MIQNIGHDAEAVRSASSTSSKADWSRAIAMFLSVVILGRFTTETHAMALLRQGPTRRHHLHHSPGRSQGLAPGVTTSESKKVKELEQEIRELKRANEILKRAASFFGAELDRQHKK